MKPGKHRKQILDLADEMAKRLDPDRTRLYRIFKGRCVQAVTLDALERMKKTEMRLFLLMWRHILQEIIDKRSAK